MSGSAHLRPVGVGVTSTDTESLSPRCMSVETVNGSSRPSYEGYVNMRDIISHTTYQGATL